MPEIFAKFAVLKQSHDCTTQTKSGREAMLKRTERVN